MNASPPGSPTPDAVSSHPIGLRGHMVPLLILTAIFFVNFIARVCYAPLLPRIEADLGLNHAEAGSLFFHMSMGYFVVLLASGWIAARISHRTVIILSAVILGITSISTAFATGLWSLRFTLLLLGGAAGLYLPSGMASLTSLIDPPHWGRAIAIHELAPNLGFVLAPLLVELIMLGFSWRAIPIALGATALILGLFFARFGKGGAFKGAAPDLHTIKGFLAIPSFWGMVVLFGLGISSTLGIYTMLPLYLITDHGMERNLANSLVAFSRVACLVMTLVGGWASDRYGPWKTMVLVFSLTGGTTVALGVVSGSWVTTMIFAQPLLAVCFFPAGFAALSQIGPAGTRHIAVSLAVPLAFMIGGGAVPILIGWIGDHFSFATGIIVLGVVIASGALLAHGIGRQVRKVPAG